MTGIRRAAGHSWREQDWDRDSLVGCNNAMLLFSLNSHLKHSTFSFSEEWWNIYTDLEWQTNSLEKIMSQGRLLTASLRCGQTHSISPPCDLDKKINWASSGISLRETEELFWFLVTNEVNLRHLECPQFGWIYKYSVGSNDLSRLLICGVGARTEDHWDQLKSWEFFINNCQLRHEVWPGMETILESVTPHRAGLVHHVR